MNTLAERLKFAMSRKNLTQADLARVSGAARSSVTNWLNGRTQNLKGKNLVKVSGVLGVSTDEAQVSVDFIVTVNPKNIFFSHRVMA